MAKAPQTVLEAAGREVMITNPEKVYFPQAGYTKLDLVRYYVGRRGGRAARHRRPADRAQALRRTAPTASRSSRSARPTRVPIGSRPSSCDFRPAARRDEIVVRDAAQLLWIANLGCIDLNPHPVRADDLDHPDELRVDLDPGPASAATTCASVALVVRDVLEDHGLRGWPKTSRLARHPRQRAHRAEVEASTRCVAPRWRSRARSSGASPSSPRASGGRKSATASSSITTRTRRTAPSPRACSVRPDAGRARLDAARRGTRSRTCDPAAFTLRHGAGAFREARRRADGDRRARRARSSKLLELSARQEAEGHRRRAVAAELQEAGRRAAARRAVEARRNGPQPTGAEAQPLITSPRRRTRRTRSRDSSAGRRAIPRPRRSSPSTTCSSTRCAAARRRGRASA